MHRLGDARRNYAAQRGSAASCGSSGNKRYSGAMCMREQFPIPAHYDLNAFEPYAVGSRTVPPGDLYRRTGVGTPGHPRPRGMALRWAPGPGRTEILVSQTDIKDLLRRVHEELGRGGTLDAETRGLLEAVAADLRRTGSTPAVATTASAHRLEELAVQFEAEHPGLSATLREIADVLGKAGV